MLILVLAYSGKEKLSEREIANIERPDKFLEIELRKYFEKSKNGAS